MYLHISKGKNCTILYVARSVRDGKKVIRIFEEKLGSTASIMEANGLSSEQEAIDWAKRHIEELNLKERTENEEVVLRMHPNRRRHLGDGSKKRNLGYMFLQKVYYETGINLICDEIQKRRRAKYDLNNIMESLLYARMIAPASKLKTSDEMKTFYGWNRLEPHQVYRALSIFADESDYIQSQLFKNSRKVLERDTTVMYYDCTNFYFETEQAEGLKQYGISKENRPNPIVEFGLFMDRRGYPVACCVHNGNESETKTMIPLEKKIINDYGINEFIVCTDAAMAFSANKIFNSAGNKHFVTTQPLRKLSKEYHDWALDPKGWRIYTPMSAIDTDAERAEKLRAIAEKKEYNLNEIDEDLYYNTIFFKRIGFRQEMKDDGQKVDVNQTLYVTFCVKHKRYQRMKRQEHIKKAEAAIKRGDKLDTKSRRDYRRFIGSMPCTKEGESAEYTQYFVDSEAIAEEEKYDGFYGVSSDIENKVNDVMTVLKNKWEIEESFRIVKTEFVARPIYLSRDERIKAHLLTCFLALFIYRVLEKHHMRERYTTTEIVENIRNANGILTDRGVIPGFEYNQCAQALQMHTNVIMDTEFLEDRKLRKISKEIKTTPDKVKRLFIPGKRPVGRPSKGQKKTPSEKSSEE